MFRNAVNCRRCKKMAIINSLSYTTMIYDLAQGIRTILIRYYESFEKSDCNEKPIF